VVEEKFGLKAGVDFYYKLLGRRDRMIKKRGYRIELAEIEAALYRHRAIKEAAVLAFPDEENVPIRAFASTRNGAKLSIIQLKKFCSENLPLYMVADLFCCVESLPKTSTDKIDYQKFKGMK
jgi:acyl-coenzyme A synthetase/AMP-(fatty) acid ligase